MNTDKQFTRAVAALPKAVRKRLDGGDPLDWTTLEDPEIGTRVSEAARAHDRLPEEVEALANRLVGDVGIAPGDLADGAERQREAHAWIRKTTIEAESESYRILDYLTGEVHAGLRPEAVAGYTVLALELATAVHEAGKRWAEAGVRHKAAPEGALSLLGLCAIQMLEYLRPQTAGALEGRTTAELAGMLDRAWNAQSLKTRASLCATRLQSSGRAHAPRRTYYTPLTGYRLHSYDPGEIRWLRALADLATDSISRDAREVEAPKRRASAVAPEPAAASVAEAPDTKDLSALGARIRAESEQAERPLQLAPPAEELAQDKVLRGLISAASRLPDAVRRRMRESYGIGCAHALSRLRSSDDASAVTAEIGTAFAELRLPRWLEELASAVLADAGAQTRDGTRTTSVRLDAGEGMEAEYLVVEVEAGAAGRLTALPLVEQVRLGLEFATYAWRGQAAIRNAGREGGWILEKGEAEGSVFSESERQILEAAQRVEHMLDRIHRARGKETPSTLEQSSMVADAFRRVGPTTRAAAGWPVSAEAPDPRMPEDIERIATASEALNERIRPIANKFIAIWVGDNGNGNGSDRVYPQFQDTVHPRPEGREPVQTESTGVERPR